MTLPELIFVGTTDLAGKLRGKAIPASALEQRRKDGVGWVPTNALITCFDTIGDGPYGSFGDLVIVPDMEAQYDLSAREGHGGFRLALGDVRDLEGRNWTCCTRSILRGALDRLHRLSGLQLQVSFEHEFQLPGLSRPAGDAFAFEGFRACAAFAEELLFAMNQLGLEPDQFIREYGPDQFEVTMRPADALRASDRATAIRALVREIARRHGYNATFSPVVAPDSVGNGVHIHMSLVQDDGTPATYDAESPGGLSEPAGRMAAGIAKYLPDYLALLAPSVISYARLTPHSWSAAFNNIGYRDREAAVRICPVSFADEDVASKFNIEVRAVDAAASPYLALAAIAHAMAQGMEENLPVPEVTEEDLSLLSQSELQARNISRLPESLVDALDRFTRSDTVRGWFGDEFCDVYRAHKESEIAFVAELDDAETYRLYRDTY